MHEEKRGPSLPSFPRSIIHPLGPIFRLLPLSLRRHLLYLNALRRWGNFLHPVRWTEKMQWRIINDRRPIMSWAADKLSQKAYVRSELERGGLNSVMRLPEVYWVGTDIRELQAIAHRLPARWALKPNHSSGRFKLFDTRVRPIDWDDLVKLGDSWIQRDEEELVLGHWAYGQARHVLIAEERVGTGSEPEAEVKGWCFGGTLHTFTLFHTLSRRNANYGREYERVFTGHELEIPATATTSFEEIPVSLRDQMGAAMEVLAAPFDHIRVDCFVDHGVVWFNELSTYARGGLGQMRPEMERARGERWKLPALSASDPRETEWRALLGPLPRGSLQ